MTRRDFIVTKDALVSALEGKSPEAIVIRTLPNDSDKLSRKYLIRTLLLG
jgi:hypothetical protein